MSTELFWDYHTSQGQRSFQQIIYQLQVYRDPEEKFVREKWSENCPVVSNSLWLHGLCSPWNSPGQNTRAGSHFLLQGIFPTQGSNPGSLALQVDSFFFFLCRWILYHLSHQGSPRILEWVVYPFSSGSSQTRNWTRVSCTADRFFTNWGIMGEKTVAFQASAKTRKHLYVKPVLNPTHFFFLTLYP